MQAARTNAGSGCGEVDPFRFQARVEHGGFKASFALLKQRFEFLLVFVEQLPVARALLRRELAEFLAHQGELALAAPKLDANGFNGFER